MGKLNAVQAAHVQSTFPEARAQMAAYLGSSAHVTIQRQTECGPDVPPFAIKAADDPDFWIDCCGTIDLACAQAKALGLRLMSR